MSIDKNILAKKIEDLLPQTQCTKCGFTGCKPYAEAIANNEANYNQCPPGGIQGIEKIASLLNKPIIALNPMNGSERKRSVAVIDENICIGCTLCIQACPVDAIVGSAKNLHNVLNDWCTGCDLCVSPCPVDCISMQEITLQTGWDAWSQEQADKARKHFENRNLRLSKQKKIINAPTVDIDDKKKDIIAQAIARAKQRSQK